MEKNYIYKLLNFLIGVSWGISLLGALVMFKIYLVHGFFIALLALLIGSMMGLFFVAVFEYILYKVSMDKKITALLEEINKKLDK